MNKLWEIHITLVRVFDGTEEDALAAAYDDWDYFQNNYDKGNWNNKPVGEAYVTPINEWSKHIGSSHQLTKEDTHEST